MVNFNDPTVISRESRECAPQAFLSKPVNWTHLPEAMDSFWNFMGGIFLWARLLLLFRCQFSLALPVGSLWSISTTSGVSFEDVAHTGGRYGSVILILSSIHNFSGQQSDLLLDILPDPCSRPRNCNSEYN